MGYREFHFAHHRFLGDPLRDPEEVYRRKYTPWMWTVPCSWKKRVLMFVADLLGWGIYEAGVAFLLIPIRRHDWMGPVLLIGSAMFFLTYWKLGLLWHWALFTVFWATFRCRAWTEHVGSETGTHETIHPKWWQLWYLPHGTNRHAEHHNEPRKRQWELV